MKKTVMKHKMFLELDASLYLHQSEAIWADVTISSWLYFEVFFKSYYPKSYCEYHMKLDDDVADARYFRVN